MLRISEHLSFAIDSIFWKEYASNLNLETKDYTLIPYKISLNSEYYKVLLDIYPATIHHTEVNYQNFINFSFFTGAMLYVKLYLYDKNFIKNFINYNENEHFSNYTLERYANRIINTYKNDGLYKVDNISVEDFIWNHPDFRRFTEDYKKKYYLDIITVDYNKAKNTFFFFKDITKINPTNFCFIVTNFKNYPQMESFNNDVYQISYKILDEQNNIVKQGTSNNLLNEDDYCSNSIPDNLKDGIYKIQATLNIDNHQLYDEMDFVIRNENNFYIDSLSDYNYLIIKNTKIQNKCYFLKMSLYNNMLKLDEINELNIHNCEDNFEILNNNILIKNIFYKNKFYNIIIEPKDKFFFVIKQILFNN